MRGDDDRELVLVGAGRVDPDARAPDGRDGPRGAALQRAPNREEVDASLHLSARDEGWAVEGEDGVVLTWQPTRELAMAAGRELSALRGLPITVHANTGNSPRRFRLVGRRTRD